MVRTIVGTLVEIGMHRRDPQWMREVIAPVTEPLRVPRRLPAALRLWVWITAPTSLSFSTRGGLDAACVDTCHLWAARVQTSVLGVQYNRCLIAFYCRGVP